MSDIASHEGKAKHLSDTLTKLRHDRAVHHGNRVALKEKLKMAQETEEQAAAA